MFVTIWHLINTYRADGHKKDYKTYNILHGRYIIQYNAFENKL